MYLSGRKNPKTTTMEKRTVLGFDITPRRALWQELQRLCKQLEIQGRHLADKQTEKDRLREAADSLRSRLKRLDAYNTQLLVEKSDCMKDCERLTELNDELKERNHSLTTELSDLREKLAVAEGTNNRICAANAWLTDENARLKDENAELRRAPGKRRTNLKNEQR